LRYVRGHREATVAQLAGVLDVSQQAVRRHLDGLRADGLIEARLERHGVGRPALIYSATEKLALDLGVKGGLTEPETDLVALAGLAWRF